MSARDDLFEKRLEHHSFADPNPEVTNGPHAWIAFTDSNGSRGRLGPYPRWMAELLMHALALDPGPITSAIIEPEPEWVTALAGD